MPGIFGVEAEALNILGEATVAGGRGFAIDAGGNGRGASETKIKLRGIRRVKGRIVRIREQCFGGRGEGAAHHGFVDEVNAKSRSMTSGFVADIVAKLVFLLISKHGKCSDGSEELIVSESFEARDGTGRGTKRERQGKAQIRIASLCQMQSTGAKNKRTHPRRAEGVLIADGQIQVVVVRGCTGGRQRRLLHQGIASRKAIECGAQKPLRVRRLRPVEADQPQIIAKGNRNAGRNRNRTDASAVAGEQSIQSELREGRKFALALWTIGDTGIFMHVFERRK